MAKPEPVTVLGIDASFTRTGYAVIETCGVPGLERVTHTDTFVSDRTETDAERIGAIASMSLQMASSWGATLVAIEQPYVGRNRQTALRLGQLIGGITQALTAAGCEVVPVPTASVSAALGIGTRLQRKAKKTAALLAVALRYGLEGITDDEADAIGVAVAAHKRKRAGANKLAQLALGIKAGPRKRRRETTG